MPNLTLKRLIEAELHCSATEIAAHAVSIKDYDEAVERYVYTFQLRGHQTAKIAYAWEALGDGTRKEPKVSIVPRHGSINSPEAAVRKVIQDLWKTL